MVGLSLSKYPCRSVTLGQNTAAHRVHGIERGVACQVLTVVDSPTSSPNSTTRSYTPAQLNITQYVWSVLSQYISPRTNNDQLNATATAVPATEFAIPSSEVSTHVKTASRLEVKNARLMSDLSNMAYDVSRVTPTVAMQRHKLLLVERSYAQADEPEHSLPLTSATHHHHLLHPSATVQSNIVPFRRASSTASGANNPLPAEPQNMSEPQPECFGDSSATCSEPDGPLQWFITDTTSHPQPLRTFAIQGSVTWDHWKINLAFDPVIFESEELGVKVHRGVYQAALDLFPVFLPYVMEHLTAHPDGQVTFTGHSLGGSVATVLMLLLVSRGFLPPSAVFPIHTFGAPAVFCDGATPGFRHCSSCQLSCTTHKQLHARHTWSSCGGLLSLLGLPSGCVRNIIMHHDIVPRAFVCDYSTVAQLLLQVGPAFKDHVGLTSSRPHKVLYNFLGTVHILQPDRRLKFVMADEFHPLLPPCPALYTVHSPNECGDCNAQQAVLDFMNSPHPLQVLQSRAAYGENGSISRYHNPDNYTKALFALLKRW